MPRLRRLMAAGGDLDAAAIRLLDLAVGLLLLVLVAPLLLMAGVLIRLESRGPVVFTQERVGLGGARFRIWKLRTMYTGSDDRTHRDLARAWFQGGGAAVGYRSSPDRRVTRVGRILRATNIDELPQLLNLVRGEMSLVGPRPAIPYELEYYESWYFQRLRVRPGITGPWQVSGRDRRSAAEMMVLDVEYAAHVSVWNYLKILARTVPVVLTDVVAVLSL